MSIPIPWIEINQVELDALRYVQAVCVNSTSVAVQGARKEGR